MVKLKGPALSGAAAGALGGTLIFSQAKGRRYLKRWHKPTDPRSHKQIAMRAILRFLSQEWRKISTPDQLLWKPLAAQTNVSPFNAFQAFNLARWRDGHGPSQIPQTDTAGYFGTGTTPTATAVSRGVLFSRTVTTVENLWALSIYNVAASEDPYAWGRLINLLFERSVATHTWTWRPIPPGTYYFALSLCKIHGEQWTSQYNRTVVVT